MAAGLLVSTAQLETAVGERLLKVPEFKFIREQAEEMGLRVWLFGGTAAGFAHYVHWDLLREAGDASFQKERFDYDFTNIYRSNQDLDIVIDGVPQQAQELQKKLGRIFPHFQGSKDAWEVRLLKTDMGEKQALLNNADFLNQHTDSNSVGMIEITQNAQEPHIRDLRDWNNPQSAFIKDIVEMRLRYYFSSKHDQTSRFLAGKNDYIISAVRYLIKAFQFELRVEQNDLETIQKIIRNFDPKTASTYAKHWLGNNSKKLIQNAVNIEYAMNTIEKLGLKNKLIEIGDSPTQIDSLAWWLSKEPLRTKPLGKIESSTSQKTAAQLGIEVVAHETNSFLAYESITRAHTGQPNVLISRNDRAGETAVHGDGFYTRMGRVGARGTGLTIRFKVGSQALEGEDFFVKDDYVIFNNRAALKVIPESLNFGVSEYIRFLDSEEISLSDRGLFEKLKRRIAARAKMLTFNEETEAREYLKSKKVNFTAWKAWFELEASQKYLDMIDVFTSQHPEFKLHMDYIFKYSSLHTQPRFKENLLNRAFLSRFIIESMINHPNINDHPEWIKGMVDAGFDDELIINRVKRFSNWKDQQEWVKEIVVRSLGNKSLGAAFIKNHMTSKEWTSQVDWIEAIMLQSENFRAGSYARALLQNIVTNEMVLNHPEWITELVRRGSVDGGVIIYALQHEAAVAHPDWILSLMERPENFQNLAAYPLNKPAWSKYPEIFEMLFRSWSSLDLSADELVNLEKNITSTILHEWPRRSHWLDHSDLKKICKGNKVTYQNLKQAFESGFTFQRKTVAIPGSISILDQIKVLRTCESLFR